MKNKDNKTPGDKDHDNGKGTGTAYATTTDNVALGRSATAVRAVVKPIAGWPGMYVVSAGVEIDEPQEGQS